MSSEFGQGVVVCLAKFSEHLSEHGPYSERQIVEYARLTPKERVRLHMEAQEHPMGDSAQMLGRIAVMDIGAQHGGPESAISRAIEMWMNAASDHFYDLDREAAPESLCQLADLVLRVGHGFTGETWTLETVQRIRELWQQACLDVDRKLGTDPDWGEW